MPGARRSSAERQHVLLFCVRTRHSRQRQRHREHRRNRFTRRRRILAENRLRQMDGQRRGDSDFAESGSRHGDLPLHRLSVRQSHGRPSNQNRNGLSSLSPASADESRGNIAQQILRVPYAEKRRRAIRKTVPVNADVPVNGFR